MLRLRELRLLDLDKMYDYFSDTEISKNFIFTRTPFSKEKLQEFIEKSWNDDRNIHFAIEDSNGIYAGTVSLKNINYIDRNAEYAIMIGKEYWGSGISYEATKQIIEYGFGKLNLHKIYLNVLASNVRANKFYEKFGFIYEGSFRQHVFTDGKYNDLNWYYLTNKGSES